MPVIKNEVTTVIKLQLYPDTSTAEILDGQSKICNWLYNHLLEHAQAMRQEFIQTKNSDIAKTVYSERGLRNLIPTIKEESSFLKVVHSSPLKNVALRLSDAIQSHQKSKKGKRKGSLVGWPSFRAWKKSWFSLLYDEPNKGFKIEDNNLILSLGMGQDRKRRSISLPIQEAHLLKEKKIRNLRIVKQLGLFYAIFTIQKIVPEKKAISRIVALDPNHKNFAYGVDLEGKSFEIASPGWLKKYDKRVDELKSKRDSCQKKSRKVEVADEQGLSTGKVYWEPSKRWKKYNYTLERALQKRREQTKTFLYTLAHDLYSKYDCVGIGDYTPNGNGITTPMRRAMNNRSLIGRFKEVLNWVAIKSGKTFIEYNEKGTTRTCNSCYYVVQEGIGLSIREWKCPSCTSNHIRDENAAINGLKQVLRDLKLKGENLISLVSCSDLVTVVERWTWCVLPSRILSILRGQNSEKYAASGN